MVPAPKCPAPKRRRRIGGAETYPTPSYTSNESSCQVEYESTTFFEVNTHYKYFSVDKPLCNFLFPLFEVFEKYFENPKSEKRSLENDVKNTGAKFHRNRSIMGKVFNVGGTI